MIALTGFADEISPDLETKLDVLQSKGISHLELRGVWGKNVLKLSDVEVDFLNKKFPNSKSFNNPPVEHPLNAQENRENHSVPLCIFAVLLFAIAVPSSREAIENKR